MFFGDSLTAGYGLSDPATQSYPAQIQSKIDAEHLSWRVVNAGAERGDERRGPAADRLGPPPQAGRFFLESGANDGLRGYCRRGDPGEPPGDHRARRVKIPGTAIVLAGMRMPASMGPDYEEAFAAVYPSLAKRNGLTLIPFLLDGVAGRPELNQPDRIHPTASGASIVADTVWKSIRPILVGLN